MSSVSSFAAISSPPSSLNRASFASRLSSPFPFPHNTRFGVKCSYAEAGVKEDSNSGTIDVVADVKTERVVVLGGSGFVGSAICKAAVSKGIEAISLSRSGRPSYSSSWVDQVTWMSVVSTLGGFGSEEQMQRINGEANVVAVTAAKDFGIPKFILISVHDYNLPSFLLSSGYFTGKRKAESEVLSKYPTSGNRNIPFRILLFFRPISKILIRSSGALLASVIMSMIQKQGWSLVIFFGSGI
ncbi:hypothetical protein ACSBR2_037467 [Camellia fascicularis]